MNTIHGQTDKRWAPQTVPIVDAHHHLWDLAAGHYPWLQDEYDAEHFFLGPYQDFCCDFMPPDYLRQSRHFPVVGTVHIEAERDRSEQLDETAWLHRIHEKYGFPNAVVAYADFGASDIEARLEQQSAFPLVRGIRCKPATLSAPGLPEKPLVGGMQDARWLQGLSLLEQHGLSWDLRVPGWHLDEAAEVARQFPGIPIALNHSGLPWDRSKEGLAIWRKRLERLADNPNVMIKLSEFGIRDADWNPVEVQDIVRQAIAIFGASRCMFGSNFPVSSVKVDYDTLLETFMAALAHLPHGDIEAVMASNATRFYRIPT
jgi:predicted TIM-barrel fold metal-dependent hydrolase